MRYLFGLGLPPSVAALLLFLVRETALKFPQDFGRVGLIVEVSDEVLAFIVRDFSVDAFAHGFVDFHCVFVGHLGLDVHFEEVVDGGLEFCLDVPELLVYFIPEYFSEDGDVVVLGGVLLDA